MPGDKKESARRDRVKAEAANKQNPVRVQRMEDPKGKQAGMFGEATMADKIAVANRAIDAKGRTGDPMNEGLFGSGKLQADLVDMAKKQPERGVHLANSLVPWNQNAEAAKISGMSDKELAQLERTNSSRATPNVAARHKLAVAEIEARKANPGWSDSARSASAEARKADMKPEALTPAEMKTLERAMTSGRGEKVSKQHAAMIARASNEQVLALDDKAMAARRANAVSDADFNRLQDFRSQFREHAKKTSNTDFNASIGRSEPAVAKNPVSEAERAGRINRLQNRAGAGGLSGKEAEKYVASNLTKLEALDAQRAGTTAQAPAAPKAAAKPRAAAKKATPNTNSPHTVTASDFDKPAAKAALERLNGLNKSQLSDVAKEMGVIPGKTVAKTKIAVGQEIHRRSHAAFKGQMAGQLGGAWGGTSDASTDKAVLAQKQARAAAEAKLHAAIDRVAQSPLETSGLRGTANAANRDAIIKNRKANAAPKVSRSDILKMANDGIPKGQPSSELYDRALKAKPTSALDRLEARQGDFAGAEKKPTSGLRGTQNAAKPMDAPTGQPSAPAAKSGSKKPGGGRALGLLAPVALAAAALVAANRSAEAGESKTKQAAAAGAEVGKGAVVMGGFMAGTAGATAGLLKLGVRAATAIPVVQGALIAGGAIHGAITAKPGERLAGATRGAWDMSLPGMVVNTGLAVKEAVDSTKARSAAPVNGRLAADQQKAFASANMNYHAKAAAAQNDDRVNHSKGWSNEARIKAYQAKAEKRGFDPKNVPYGGKQSEGPSQWVSNPDLSKKRN